MTPYLVEAAKPLYDKSASWGGPVAAIVASVIFVAFAVWIIVQRIRSDHHRTSHDVQSPAPIPPGERAAPDDHEVTR